MIEIHHLRCFVGVAEELHFGRAAVRLNMTQPPLSRQIQLLERIMHCDLFVRSSRSVKLTREGESFLPEAQRILRLLDTAQSLVSDVSTGRRGLVRCGFTAVSAYEILPAIISRFKRENPDVSLSLLEMVSTRQREALIAEDLDIGILRPPIDKTIFEMIAVLPEAMVVALPAGHPLNAKKNLSWSDLDGIDMIGFDRQEGQYLHDLLAAQFLEYDVSPRIIHRLSQVHSILALVRAGLGVAVVPKSARVLDVSSVEYYDMDAEQSAHAKLFIVWRKNNDNPLIGEFIEAAQSLNAG